MKLMKYFFTVIIALVMFTSCSDDEGNPETGGAAKTKAIFNFDLPSGDFTIDKYSIEVMFTELNTKEITKITVDKLPFSVELTQGSYEISAEGSITYIIDGITKEGSVAAFVSELNLTESTQELDNIKLVLKSSSTDLIIEEIFFTGSLTSEGKQYNDDKYIKLYNNTGAVIYADGLIIADSEHMTVNKQAFTPDIMSEAFATGAMIQIPGAGEEHPVQPGESIVVSLSAINHKEINPLSADLSTVSDFEIFNRFSDVDSPSTPNMINFYDNIIFHNRGFHSFALVRLPKDVTKDSFLVDYVYDYSYDFVHNGTTYPMNQSAMKIPNSWIVDAVNLSVESEFQWIITDPSLDSGWTYCGKVDKDATRYSKSVQRKVLQEVNGVRLLKDTNNSTNDFDAEQVPSLL